MPSEAENEGYVAEQQGQSAGEPAPSTGFAKLRCPRCQSSRIRKRTRPFLLHAGLSVLLGVAAVSCFAMVGSGLVPLGDFPVFILFGALGISLLVLPLTAVVAIAGRDRCSSCRHRFGDAHETDQENRAWRVMLWSYVLNFVLLFGLCVVGRSVLRAQSNGGALPNIMAVAGGIFVFGFFSWGLLIYQFVLHQLLRRRITRPVVWVILFVLPAVLIGGWSLSYSLPSAQAGRILSNANLAPLPKSATDVKAYVWSSPFSGEEFLRFRASPEEIERFLRESPILQGVECERFSKERMRLPAEAGLEKWRPYEQAGHETFIPRSTTPVWYKQEIRSPARRYIIQPERYQFPGEVLVDDEENVVFVYLCFS
ncbi:MAG: hypothetical protein JSU70_13515 [Phycisphaerales bacterium]|nr:MAG: hypothetical protein JSU70_13515 [Phycisphaerales bacterium]